MHLSILPIATSILIAHLTTLCHGYTTVTSLKRNSMTMLAAKKKSSKKKNVSDNSKSFAKSSSPISGASSSSGNWMPISGLKSMKDLDIMNTNADDSNSKIQVVETKVSNLITKNTNPDGAVCITNYKNNIYCFSASCASCQIPMTKAKILPPNEETSNNFPRIKCSFCSATYNVRTGAPVSSSTEGGGLFSGIVKNIYSAQNKNDVILPTYDLALGCQLEVLRTTSYLSELMNENRMSSWLLDGGRAKGSALAKQILGTNEGFIGNLGINVPVEDSDFDLPFDQVSLWLKGEGGWDKNKYVTYPRFFVKNAIQTSSTPAVGHFTQLSLFRGEQSLNCFGVPILRDPYPTTNVNFVLLYLKPVEHIYPFPTPSYGSRKPTLLLNALTIKKYSVLLYMASYNEQNNRTDELETKVKQWRKFYKDVKDIKESTDPNPLSTLAFYLYDHEHAFYAPGKQIAIQLSGSFIEDKMNFEKYLAELKSEINQWEYSMKYFARVLKGRGNVVYHPSKVVYPGYRTPPLLPRSCPSEGVYLVGAAVGDQVRQNNTRHTKAYPVRQRIRSLRQFSWLQNSSSSDSDDYLFNRGKRNSTEGGGVVSCINEDRDTELSVRWDSGHETHNHHCGKEGKFEFVYE